MKIKPIRIPINKTSYQQQNVYFIFDFLITNTYASVCKRNPEKHPPVPEMASQYRNPYEWSKFH